MCVCVCVFVCVRTHTDVYIYMYMHFHISGTSENLIDCITVHVFIGLTIEACGCDHDMNDVMSL